MSVAGLTLDPRNSQHIVVLNDETKRRALPIWIGAAEARAILLAFEHVKTDRPMTHDLLFNTIREVGCSVEQVEIDTMKSDVYIAKITLLKRGKSRKVQYRKKVDARPSDAIALALVAEVPIYVSNQVLSAGAVPVVNEEEDRTRQEFKKFLDGVKASDFNAPGLALRQPEADAESSSAQSDIDGSGKDICGADEGSSEDQD
jgi:bifunctional DNase/RNase